MKKRKKQVERWYNVDSFLEAVHVSLMAFKVPVIALVYFRPGGIIVCKLEGASFWEKTPGADYLPHQLTLPEGKDNSDDILYLCLSQLYFLCSKLPSI